MKRFFKKPSSRMATLTFLGAIACVTAISVPVGEANGASTSPYTASQNFLFTGSDGKVYSLMNALRQDQINSPNGIAGLDSSGLVESPIGGSILKAPLNRYTAAYSDSAYTVVSAGSGYSVGDVLMTSSDGGLITVTAISNSGGVTGISVSTPGESSSNNQSNVESTSYYLGQNSSLTGSGTGLTVEPSQVSIISSPSYIDFSAGSMLDAPTLRQAVYPLDGAYSTLKAVQNYVDTSNRNIFRVTASDQWPSNSGGTDMGLIVNKTRSNGRIFYSDQTLYHGWQSAYGGVSDQGDITIQPWNGSLLHTRLSNDLQGIVPMDEYLQVNSSPNIVKWNFTDIGGMYAKTPMLDLTSIQTGNAVGSATGLSALVYDETANPDCQYACQNQVLDISSVRGGTSSTWGLSIAMTDSTHSIPGSFAQTGIEDDMGANGPDAGNPEYSPQDGNRKNIWVGISAQGATTKYSGARKGSQVNYTSYLTWSASTAVTSGSVLKVLGSDNRYYLYQATSSGTTSSSQPAFPGTSGTVTDGTVTWTYNYPYAAGFSKGIFLDGNNYNKNAFQFYYTGITSNALFANAFIDTTQISIIDPSQSFTVDSSGNPEYVASATGAAIRIGQGQVIDISGTATSSGHNNNYISSRTPTTSVDPAYSGDTWNGFYTSGDTPAIVYDSLHRTMISGITWLAGSDRGGSSNTFFGDRIWPANGLTILRDIQNGTNEIDFVNVPSGFSFYQATPADISSDGTLPHTSDLSLLLDLKLSGSTLNSNLTVTGSLSVSGGLTSIPMTYATLPQTPAIGFAVFCMDCYSYMRNATYTKTGAMAYWNGADWVDAVGNIINH